MATGTSGGNNFLMILVIVAASQSQSSQANPSIDLVLNNKDLAALRKHDAVDELHNALEAGGDVFPLQEVLQ